REQELESMLQPGLTPPLLEIRMKPELSNGPSISLLEKKVKPVKAEKARQLPRDLEKGRIDLPKAFTRLATRTAKLGNVSRLSSNNKDPAVAPKERDKTKGWRPR
ncbi:hypothetical protein MKW94_009732, partial [Papaver nudicaule]|nr:hypothetical protein [Papaver nudicaule]